MAAVAPMTPKKVAYSGPFLASDMSASGAGGSRGEGLRAGAEGPSGRGAETTSGAEAGRARDEGSPQPLRSK